MALESVVGNLQTAYRQIEPGTMQPAAAIQVERHTNEDMQNQWFYTAEGLLYYKGEGREIKPSSSKVMLALTQEKDNLVLRHLDDTLESDNSFIQLTKNGNYFPKREEAAASILATPQERIVDLTQVRLKGTEKEFRYLELDTSPKAYTKLNAEERKLASVYYGSMEPKECADDELKSDFELTMEKFHGRGIKKTRVYVVAPDYVVEQVSEQKPVIARASVLDYFGYGSGAGTGGRNVDLTNRVRGVHRVVVESVEEAPPVSDLEGLMREF